MDDADIGFYMRCLNHAWINGGVPADPRERARVLHTRLDIANRRWERVGKCFETSTSLPNQLVNPRQESERESCLQKSLKATESINRRWKPDTNVSETNGVRNTRAFVSDSDSASASVLSISKKENSLQREKSSSISKAFAAFWIRWCELTGRRQHEAAACQAWVGVVTVEGESIAMACLERYGGSDEVKRGIVTNPEKWLYDQARDKFAGEWQARSDNQSTKMDRTMEILQRNLAIEGKR